MPRSTVFLAALALACTPPTDKDADPDAPSPILDLAEDDSWQLDGLGAEAYVVWTEAGIPHVYAEDRADASRVFGFTIARDRFFQVDLVRRLSTGRLSELLGDVIIDADIEARSVGMTHAVDSLIGVMTDDQKVLLTAYADGFNDYIDGVRAGRLPPPSEYELLSPLLQQDPEDLLEPFELRDVAAIFGTVLYRLGYETEDVGRTAQLARMETLFADETWEGDARLAAAWAMVNDVTPVKPVASAPDWTDTAAVPEGQGRPPKKPRVPLDMLDRAGERFDALQLKLGRDRAFGYGSNAWVVAGDKTADGRSLVGYDAHLELDIPGLFYQIAMDTTHLGGGDFQQAGEVIAGMPVLGMGTNGDVAWGFTQHVSDITDWYAEELQLDADGGPAASFFDGAWQPLVQLDETYEVAGVLGGTARTATVPRWTTFDGRWITDIEGRPASSDTEPAAGETLVNAGGAWVIPEDTDGDGIISGISFDFTGLDASNLALMLDEMGLSSSIDDFEAAHRKSNALSLNLVATDKNGEIYYNGYQMVPCRTYLPRDADGAWLPGADPRYLLDGTTYGGFEVPLDDDFSADETSTDPYRCVAPFDWYPKSRSPDQGFLLSANNDPGGLSFDGTLEDHAYLIGGPWNAGFRPDRIQELLATATEAGTTDLDTMKAVQNDHVSVYGRYLVPHLLDALTWARRGIDAPLEREQRAIDLILAHEAPFAEVEARLQAWADGGYLAASGVQTFYDPEISDAEQADAVATMIANVWIGDLVRRAIDDEGLPGVAFHYTGAGARMRILSKLIETRGDDMTWEDGFNADHAEYMLWDDRSTADVVEWSDEIMLLALVDSLEFLASAPTAADEGGFGTDDMDQWLWGLRHQVEFESLVMAYVDDPLLGTIFARFAIDTERVALGDDIDASDPRAGLTWYPRPGDHESIDAANSGTSGRNFRYDGGPINRSGWALGPDGPEGYTIIPGGASGILESEHYDDQVGQWLGNEVLPFHWSLDDVIAHSERRETFTP